MDAFLINFFIDHFYLSLVIMYSDVKGALCLCGKKIKVEKKTPDVGLEPTTLGLRVPCSTVLS